MLLVCLHIYLFRLCIKKDSEKGVTLKYFIYLRIQISILLTPS